METMHIFNNACKPIFLYFFFSKLLYQMCRGVEGSRLEAWMKSHKSDVAITTFYLHTSQPGNSVGKDTSKQNI